MSHFTPTATSTPAPPVPRTSHGTTALIASLTAAPANSPGLETLISQNTSKTNPTPAPTSE